MQSMLDAEATPGPISSLLRRPGIRQFIKFCIIGFTSMVIDVGIAYVLTYRFHWHATGARVVSFSFAVTNGYIWNSMWTFRGLGSGARHEQYAKFVGVNVIGLGLNLAIMNAISLAMTGQLMAEHPPKLVWSIAMGVAVVCVSLFNFFANKHYTFKPAPDAE